MGLSTQQYHKSYEGEPKHDDGYIQLLQTFADNGGEMTIAQVRSHFGADEDDNRQKFIDWIRAGQKTGSIELFNQAGDPTARNDAVRYLGEPNDTHPITEITAIERTMGDHAITAAQLTPAPQT